MAIAATDAYDGVEDLPPLVAAAVGQARSLSFEHSCPPSHGRLLRLLAGGITAGVIGGTGTGTGDAARLHWLEHPRLLATLLRTQPDAVTIVATLTGG